MQFVPRLPTRPRVRPLERSGAPALPVAGAVHPPQPKPRISRTHERSHWSFRWRWSGRVLWRLDSCARRPWSVQAGRSGIDADPLCVGRSRILDAVAPASLSAICSAARRRGSVLLPLVGRHWAGVSPEANRTIAFVAKQSPNQPARGPVLLEDPIARRLAYRAGS